jgi:transposase
MFGTHRAIYNKLVEVSRADCYSLSKKALADKYREISQKRSLEKHLPAYHLEVPEEVMDSTYRDFIKAIVASKALFKSLKSKQSQTSFPSLKFKSRKDNTTSIELRARGIKTICADVKAVCFAPKYFGFKKGAGVRIKEDLPPLDYSARLQMTREGDFYMCVPRYKIFSQETKNRTCAIDPGVRDFITIYDPKGLTMGVTDSKEAVFRRCLLIDKLKSKLSKSTCRRERHRLNHLIYRLFQRVKCMVKDMHNKCAKWLSDNYDEVLLPVFNTSDMTKKQSRISSQTSRSMLTWSHYSFRMLLTDKMQRSGGRLIECSEEWSSKTCSACGVLNRKLTSQKKFTCGCGHVLDRDVNGARNIYLMNEHRLVSAPVAETAGTPTSRSLAE